MNGLLEKNLINGVINGGYFSLNGPIRNKKIIRAAYRSLRANLPYLFSYLNHPELNIPDTNNSLEGYFSRLKQLLNNHHGPKRWRRYKLIEMILSN